MSRPICKDSEGGIITCLYCRQDLYDGREESGFTGEGPDYCTADGDFGCGDSPDTDPELGTGSHTPSVITLWDGNIIRILMFELPYGNWDARGRP